MLLDLGMQLYDEGGNDYPFGTPQMHTVELLQRGVLRDVPELYVGGPAAPAFAAIILTHSHRWAVALQRTWGRTEDCWP